MSEFRWFWALAFACLLVSEGDIWRLLSKTALAQFLLTALENFSIRRRKRKSCSQRNLTRLQPGYRHRFGTLPFFDNAQLFSTPSTSEGIECSIINVKEARVYDPLAGARGTKQLSLWVEI